MKWKSALSVLCMVAVCCLVACTVAFPVDTKYDASITAVEQMAPIDSGSPVTGSPVVVAVCSPRMWSGTCPLDPMRYSTQNGLNREITKNLNEQYAGRCRQRYRVRSCASPGVKTCDTLNMQKSVLSASC